MPKTTNASTRPYRSHKIRACDFCRKRKSRCTLDLPGRACVMNRSLISSPAISSASGAASHTESESRPSRLVSTFQAPERTEQGDLNERDSESAHIIGPILANDTQVVEQFISPENRTGDIEVPYNIYYRDKEEPILYTKVSRHRPGFESNGCAGAKQREILEQILGPSANELVDLYFNKIHPSFPILDKNCLKYSENQHTLVCEIYAIALLYWDSSPVLRKYPRPDMSYAWNLAVMALQEEFLSPRLSTIQCVLVDLTGRPSLWLTGNLINSGRAIALAHSFGLHRNPRKWRIKKVDQDIRIQLWWGIVIHDRWASFAHGVPPNITRTNYDVPLPTVDDLISTGLSPQNFKSAEAFVALCRLSEILGDILPLIYDLQMNLQRNTAKGMRKSEVDLDDWEDELPEWLDVAGRKPLLPIVSGSSSLQLGFYAMRLLICRIRLHEATQSPVEIEKLHYYRTECRKGAMEIVDFVLSLQKGHLEEFWLPYSGYHLNSTAIVLLRCAIESGDETIKKLCLSSVKRFLTCLDRFNKEHDWDIAEVCLKHCQSTMLRLASLARPLGEETFDAMPEIDGAENNDSSDDFGLPDGSAIPWLGDGMLEGYEFSMDAMWDNLESGTEHI